MDMTRFLKPFLTVPTLQALGGEYEGIIAEVRNERLRNRYKATSEEQAVVVFSDGKQLVLNKTLLKSCLQWFGDDSEKWIFRRVRVFLREGKRGRLERAMVCEDPHARAPVAHIGGECHPTFAGPTNDESNGEVPVTADDIGSDDPSEES